MKSNKFWIVLFCALVLLLVLVSHLTPRTTSSKALIYADRTLLVTIDLAHDTTRLGKPNIITVHPDSIYDGRYIIVETDYGRIRVLEANCPDKWCIRQGWITTGSGPIVCLPQRIVIRVVGDSDSDFELDAVVG